MIEINGMAHVILTVSSWEKARAFYGELLPFLGLTKVYDGNNFLYHVGGRTAVDIQRCAPEHEGLRFGRGRRLAPRVGTEIVVVHWRSPFRTAAALHSGPSPGRCWD
jgi:catechol 2,3-dioxygenase-like lactoylglutathione lyase family enzyme